MSERILQQNSIVPDLPEIRKSSDQDHFGETVRNLTNFEISPKTISEIRDAIKKSRLVVIPTNHGSYGEIEEENLLLEMINEGMEENQISAYILYSAPAVEGNIGNMFHERRPFYAKNGLIMLGIIRDSDRQDDSPYKKFITPQMEVEHKINYKKYASILMDKGCIIIDPFEATLHGGRKNKITGKQNGMVKVDEAQIFDKYVKRGVIFVPCGIENANKLVDPDNEHQKTEIFVRALEGEDVGKIVTFKLGEPIDSVEELNKGETPENIGLRVVHGVAKNLSPISRGYYQDKI